jgi:hypothetical protein
MVAATRQERAVPLDGRGAGANRKAQYSACAAYHCQCRVNRYEQAADKSGYARRFGRYMPTLIGDGLPVKRVGALLKDPCVRLPNCRQSVNLTVRFGET